MPEIRGGRIAAWLASALLVPAVVVLPIPGASAAETFVVTSTADTDGTTCAAICTLRQAVGAANLDSETRDTIEFDIPNAGPHTIAVGAQLSPINVVLDGLTQPGSIVGQPVVTLDGSGMYADVLHVHDSLVRGLRIIPSNGGSGIVAWQDNVVQANVIGFTPGQSGPVSSGQGITVLQNNNVIGVSTDGINDSQEGNVISRRRIGVALYGANNVIAGNRIGTNEAGTAAVPNIDGIFVFGPATGSMIGGTEPHAGNVVSGNGLGNHQVPGSGITVGGDATGVTIQGNWIGTTAGGTTPLANAHGIIVNGDGTVIGGTGPGEGNVIARNRYPTNSLLGEGVAIQTTMFATPIGNIVRGNSIFANGGMDIGVGNNASNDPGDADEGANGLQNVPTLVSQTNDGTDTTIEGSLQSKPNTPYDIDFYSNASCGRDLHYEREGKTYLGAITVMTDDTGSADISAVFDEIDLNPITATATGPEGTSAFSHCLAASLAAQADENDTYRSAQVGSEFTYQLLAVNSGPVPAPQSTLSFPLPEGVIALEATSDQGSCTIEETSVGCDVGTLAPISFVPVTIRAVGTRAIDERVLADLTSDHVYDLSTSVLGIRTEIKGKSCTIVKTAESESFAGTSGDDVLCGLGGDDAIDGKGGNDTIYGGSGEDTMNGSGGGDLLSGGAGDDTATFATATRAVDANLDDGSATGAGSDDIKGVENLIGSAYADTLTGSALPNSLYGGAAGDKLFGLGGADSLFGQGGNDSFNGGGGNDSCKQGSGSGPRTNCE